MRKVLKFSGILSLMVILSATMLSCSVTAPVDNPELTVPNSAAQTGSVLDEGNYYRIGGDMLLDKANPKHMLMVEQILSGFPGSTGSLSQKGMRETNISTWPNGLVPYYYSGTFTTNERQKIEEAMRAIELTCKVKFVETTYRDWCYKIERSTDSNPNIGGSSTTGWTEYPVYKFKDASLGIIMHELIHCLGFGHEHQRPDRDSYVTIDMDNIKDDYKSDFISLPAFLITAEYDYDSIMHYGNLSNVPSVAIDPTKPLIDSRGHAIGQDTHLSQLDRLMLRVNYNDNSTRFCALMAPSSEQDMQINGYTFDQFKTRLDEIWPLGWRIKTLEPYLWNGFILINASFVRTSAAQYWYVGLTRQDLINKANELFAKGWRIKTLKPYVVNNQELFAATWEVGSRDEWWIAGYTRQDFITKRDQMFKQGWRLSALSSYIINGQEMISALWNPGMYNEPWVIGWTREDFLAKCNQLFAQGWRLKIMQPYMWNGVERYNAVWSPGSKGERTILAYRWEDYLSFYTAQTNAGWRLKSLSAF